MKRTTFSSFAIMYRTNKWITKEEMRHLPVFRTTCCLAMMRYTLNWLLLQPFTQCILMIRKRQSKFLILWWWTGELHLHLASVGCIFHSSGGLLYITKPSRMLGVIKALTKCVIGVTRWIGSNTWQTPNIRGTYGSTRSSNLPSSLTSLCLRPVDEARFAATRKASLSLFLVVYCLQWPNWSWYWTKIFIGSGSSKCRVRWPMKNPGHLNWMEYSSSCSSDACIVQYGTYLSQCPSFIP